MGDLDTTISALLTAVTAALTNTPAGAPTLVCDVPGQITWDECDCGTLYTTVDRLYPAHAFPADSTDWQLLQPCPPPYQAAEIMVTVLRCAPAVNQSGVGPSAQALTDAAAQWLLDVELARDAIACTLVDLRTAGVVEEWSLRGTEPAGSTGACLGSDTRLNVAFTCGKE